MRAPDLARRWARRDPQRIAFGLQAAIAPHSLEDSHGAASAQ